MGKKIVSLDLNVEKALICYDMLANYDFFWNNWQSYNYVLTTREAAECRQNISAAGRLDIWV